MKKGLWNKRIPTILAFLVLSISIWVTSFLIQTGVIFVGRATPDKTPQNISISNITDTSFTVTFTTNDRTLAGLSVEEGNAPPFAVFDDRTKKTGQQIEFYSHVITISDLKPKTTYDFSIISDGDTYLDGNKKFEVTTGAIMSQDPPKQNPITGKVLLSDGNPGQDSIIQLEIEGAQLSTSVTKEDGTFIIPTNSLRDSAFDKFFVLDANQEITINILKQDLKSTLKTLFKDAESIPPITLQKNYDFTKIEEEEISTLSSQLKAPTPRVGFGDVQLLTPKPSESFIDSRPLFRGTAVPNQTVKITIESNSIKAEIKADNNGVWSFRPVSPLTPGEHTITIETTDRFGILRTISQRFVVFASGSQVAESATPSATPSITNTPTPTQPPSPTVSVSPQVTVTQTPTNIPTSIPIQTPTGIASLSPTLIPTNIPIITPPAPGSSTSLVLTVISVLLIFAGSALLFLL